MGRQVRKVAVDFNWPIGMVWDGFVNPYYEEKSGCPACYGSGGSAISDHYRDQWYGNAPFDPVQTGSKDFPVNHPVIARLAARNASATVCHGIIANSWPHWSHHEQRLMETCPWVSERLEAVRLAGHFNKSWSHHLSQADVDALVAAGRLPYFTHRPRTAEQAATLAASGGYWMNEPNGYHPTAQEVNEWSLTGIGHDSINQWVCVKDRCIRAGDPSICDACGGSGEKWASAEAEQRAEEWKPTDPPAGEYWQLWETVSEGSPISPACATAEELADWLAINDGHGLSAKEWLTFLTGNGWAPSAMTGKDGALQFGVRAVVESIGTTHE